MAVRDPASLRRSRYRTVFRRRYILIRSLTLVPAVIFDLLGYLLAPLFRRRNDSEPVRRVLAIRLDHIGDVLITTPALRVLRETFPNARLDILTGSWAADLVRDDPDLDEVQTFDASWFGGKEGFGGVLKLIRRLRRQNYDLIIDFRGDPRHLLIARFAGSRRVLGFGIRGGGFLLSEEVHYPPEAHEVERALALVRTLGAGDTFPGGLKIQIRPDDAEKAEALFAEVGVDTSRLVVALCPASRNPSRWWQGSKFSEVAAHLGTRYGAQVLVFGSTGDAAAASEVLAAGLPGVRSLIGRTSLPVFAAALARVDLIVSVESSPIHFASALGKPIVTLFGGSSLPKHWGPYLTENRIVQTEVSCAPCHQIRCPLPEVLCMQGITAGDVTNACDELLERLGETDSVLENKMRRN